jgi:hypothetical protein
MPGYLFVARPATDLLEFGGHGMLTGDGPATAVVPNGSFGGLTSAADYWIIRNDADSIKLATSQANALAGIAVNITGADFNCFVGLGLPYRRARTYVPKSLSVPGSQIASADLNKLQEAVTKLAKSDRAVHHSAWTGTNGTALNIVHTSLGYSTLSSSGSFYAPLQELKVGSIIEWATFYYNRKGAGTMTPRIMRLELATGAITAADPGAADAASPDAIQVVTFAPDHVVVAGFAYYLEVIATNALNRVYGAIYSARGDAGL